MSTRTFAAAVTQPSMRDVALLQAPATPTRRLGNANDRLAQYCDIDGQAFNAILQLSTPA